jgi:hypothetical protein
MKHTYAYPCSPFVVPYVVDTDLAKSQVLDMNWLSDPKPHSISNPQFLKGERGDCERTYPINLRK